MADPGTLALAGLAIGTATQTVGGLMASGERSAAASFEAQQSRVQEGMLRTQASQDEARRRENLNQVIGNILAIRAGRGVGTASPTGNAILSDITGATERDIGINRANILTRADQARMSGEFADRRARLALIAGDFGAVSNLATAGFNYARYSRTGLLPSIEGV